MMLITDSVPGSFSGFKLSRITINTEHGTGAHGGNEFVAVVDEHETAVQA
jgi:hypothetical protein